MQFKRLIGGAGIAIALAAAVVPYAETKAAAYGAAFSTAITFQNVGTAAATVEFDFFQENTAAGVKVPGGTLQPGASNSLGVGSVSNLGTFTKGSAVLSSNQPVVATIVQFNSTGIKNQPLSNGFGDAEAAERTLVATALKNTFGTTTIFSVQNVAAEAANITVDFYRIGESAVAYSLPLTNTPAYSARYVDLGKITQLGTAFNGSAIVRSALGSGAAAKTVVTINELGTSANIARAFEGVGTGSNTVYMPSALCNYSSGRFTHGYAVQNAGTTPVTYEVEYFPFGRAAIKTAPITLQPGGKQSMPGCTASGINGMPPNVLGSAIIRRTGGAENALVAVAKFNNPSAPGRFLDSAAVGIPEGGGGLKLAAPYVRWSPNSQFNAGSAQRSFLAIQNVGTAVATNVRVQYINKDGAVIATQTLGNLNPGAKANSTAESARALDAFGRFGYYGPNGQNTQFGGGVYILADAGSLAAVVRSTVGGTASTGEDYNAIKIQ